MEHYRPKEKFPRLRDRYNNLLWSCHACNRAKGDKWSYAHSPKFLDPCSVAFGNHLELNGEAVNTVAGSQSGQYMIDAISLNSAVHRQRRKRRLEKTRRVALLTSVLQQAQQINSDPQTAALLVIMDTELKAIEAECGLRKSDPTAPPCRC